ncbi:ABC transporter substrate-binding protein [Micromonospora sp. NBC_01796]|uniref:ABC transporter substrate-binding protein n=1 Tax=Micromonospora sp. NBC_01796 TaxID=2975987 RepID=UPI002DD82FBA|nr:ABC transporter substrate-binding protein [Micromonospora sp. NBC_01796]WSA85548.1 ABC transporter substrate-binding protein [Micromonospora sp. NBC_01796]
MRRKLAVVLAAAMLLTACGGGGDGESTDSGAGDQATKITVGVIPILDVAPIYLGVQKGFFADRKLEVKLELAQGGAAIVPAVLSGQFQFGFSNNTSLLLAQTRGLPLKIVAPGPSSTGTPGKDFAGVVVPESSPIKSSADLSGKSVAINTLNNISDTVVREAVRKAGGDPKTVKFVELPFPDMPAAVANGRVDAAFIVEPFLTIARNQKGRDISSAYAEATPNLSVATYFTSEALLKSDPDLVRAFTDAMVESQAYASAHPDETRQVLSTYTSIGAEIIPTLTLPSFPAEINRQSIQALADLALRDGLVTKAPQVDALFQ